jgi:hypothetical protein
MLSRFRPPPEYANIVVKRGIVTIGLMLFCFSLLPATALSQTYTVLSTDDLFPTGGADDHGPANQYPSTLTVAGLTGKVTKVRVTILGYRSAEPQDTDIVLVGPKGQKVLLMADACGTMGFQNNNWTFDDSAQTYLSAIGPCPNYQATSFKPSGYLGDDQADMRQFGAAGPPPPYGNKLAVFKGNAPNGKWRLYVLDDTEGYNSFDIAAWALRLDVRTGQRAAALKKCKKIADKQKRQRCINKANKLPV